MAEPLTTLDLAMVAAVVVALASAISVLWLAFKKQVGDLEKTQVEGRKELGELVHRIRSLEEARLNEVKEHAKKLEELNKQSMVIFSKVVNALQDITKTISTWMNRPCMVAADAESHPTAHHHSQSAHPSPLPDVSTEALMRLDGHPKHPHQDHA